MRGIPGEQALPAWRPLACEGPMLEDAWLDAHGKLLEFSSQHGNLVWASVVLAIVGYFLYRWRAAR